LEAQALDRARELQAIEEGSHTPAKQASAKALYAYEEGQTYLKGRTFRANRTRKMLADHGPLMAAERMVLSSKASVGYDVLGEAGLQELSFESIVIRFPDEFSEDAQDASRARLEGRPSPRRRITSSTGSRKENNGEGGDHFETPEAAWLVDAEAQSFLDGFRSPQSWVLDRWLPNYSSTIKIMAAAVDAGRPEDIFDLVWKTKNNSISEAGLGQISHKLVDSKREELLQVLRDIIVDPSPESHERIVQRFMSWKEESPKENVPHLLIARAFAGIHPSIYHTTVDRTSHNLVLEWFVEHTGFILPPSTDWAARARALTVHLDRSGIFGDDALVRNLFPWFVIDQLRARAGNIKSGHVERAASAFAHLPEQRRDIELRHNRLQTILFRQLVVQFGRECVWTECPTGTGGFADALVRLPDASCRLYEIKIADSASEVVRQAIGQLLEYSYRPGGLNPVKLVVVGEPSLDSGTKSFLQRLDDDFNLPIEYLQMQLSESATLECDLA
jgi:hypothetical protein